MPCQSPSDCPKNLVVDKEINFTFNELADHLSPQIDNSKILFLYQADQPGDTKIINIFCMYDQIYDLFI